MLLNSSALATMDLIRFLSSSFATLRRWFGSCPEVGFEDISAKAFLDSFRLATNTGKLRASHPDLTRHV